MSTVVNNNLNVNKPKLSFGKKLNTNTQDKFKSVNLESNTNTSNEIKPEKQNEPFLRVPTVIHRALRQKYPKLLLLWMDLADCYLTYKYGLIGIHSEVTQSKLAKLSKIDRRNIGDDLNKLESMGFIKIYNKAPLLIQLQHIEGVTPLNDIYAVLQLTIDNINDFNIYPNSPWGKKFYKIYSKQFAELYNDPFNFKKN